MNVANFVGNLARKHRVSVLRGGFAVALLGLLAACGGGGSDGGGVTLPPKNAITFSPASGASVSPGSAITVSTSNATNAGTASMSCDGNPVATVTVPKDGSANLSTPATNAACTVAVQVDQASSSASYTVSDGKLHYSQTVFGRADGGQYFIITKTGFVSLLNKTSYQTGGYPIWNCWRPVASPKLSDGKVLISCQDADPASLRRHYLYINPVDKTVNDYSGDVPTGLQCTENSDKTWTCPPGSWMSFQASPPSGAPAGAVVAAQVSDGWYYTTNANQRLVLFTPTTQIGEKLDIVFDIFVVSN